LRLSGEELVSLDAGLGGTSDNNKSPTKAMLAAFVDMLFGPRA
jgi:hypothetical protein